MKRVKGRGRLGAVMALMLICCGCSAIAKRPRCRVDISPMPSWVHHVEILEGYYVGIGQAGPVDGGIFLQRQLARRRAMGQVIQNIRVMVESSMELTEREETEENGDTLVSRSATRHLRVASRLSLNEVTEAGSYLDPVTCILWVCIKIRRDLADNLIALKQAKGLYRMTLDETMATPAQKLRWITEAQARLDDVDFSVLPKDAGNENHLTALLAKRKAELEKRGSRKTVWLLSAPSYLRQLFASSLHTLAVTHGAIYVDTPCIAAHDCLGQAREYAGENLVWIKADGNTSSGSLGMHEGTLRLGIARFDLDTGSLLSIHSEEGHTFAFDKRGLEWAELAEQLLGKSEMEKVLE